MCDFTVLTVTKRHSLWVSSFVNTWNEWPNLKQLEAIKQTNVDMEVYVGNYVLPEDNEPYVRQRDIIKDAIQTYGIDHIAGVTVGNEFMLKYVVLQHYL